MQLLLNDNWTMKKSGTDTTYPCQVPCSVYKTLLEEHVIDDPYYRENEYISTPICDDDYEFEKHFVLSEADLHCDKVYLTFQGIDTLADILLNGTLLARTNNMHRTWELDVTEVLIAGDNTLLVACKSPNKYVTEKQTQRPLWGVDSTMPGFPHLRKVHCMFGWDWGPVLPDMGIWRDVSLTFCTGGKINHVYYSQEHENDKVLLQCKADIASYQSNISASLTVTAPDGMTYHTELVNGIGSISIENPQLWWVNGLGEQPLYTCEVCLQADTKTLCTNTQRIGIRTLTISQEKDEWGEEFCFINNGVKIFAMGANYIPEDQIVTRCTKEKTIKLLEECKKANFNFIRIWGGGYYPNDYFYNWCDENGFIVWQDFMFACAAYLLTEEFKDTVAAEIKDNIIRLRNHASLGLWCGNNEIESAWEYWGLPEDPQAKADYLTLFEELIPSILKEYDSQGNTFYWPSSPSSGGGFQDASSNHAGDMHYWDVWHGLKPIEDFRKFYYRFCSEYGFESLPDIKTCEAFAEESLGDYDLCSPVMEAHQKCTQGNEKIMYYLAQMVRYPYDFRQMIYASQLVQSDCIRSNVEHMRRARGRCMGSAYWQVNDSNPVISWSSIDYFGRWKGLHYTAKRFYTPCLVSVDDSDILHPIFNISNERPRDFVGTLNFSLRSNKAEILLQGSIDVTTPALSAKNVLTLDLSSELTDRMDKREKYLTYSITEKDEVLSKGSTLFVRPKEFTFLEPNIQVAICEDTTSFHLTLTATNYAKSVCLSLNQADCVFSDNWFDIHGAEPVEITIAKADMSEVLTLTEVEEQLEIMYN